jgi:hypothetical protein
VFAVYLRCSAQKQGRQPKLQGQGVDAQSASMMGSLGGGNSMTPDGQLVHATPSHDELHCVVVPIPCTLNSKP